jgi:O-antigen/teichoic acid export membrane protein
LDNDVAPGGNLLSNLTRKPTFLVTFQVIFAQTFTILLFAIQARLLGPQTFGLMALVMVAVGFCESVVIAVATETLISVREINDLHFATATLATSVAAFLLGAIMFFSADAAAKLLGDAELSPVLRWMAALPLISALWVAPTAATKRNMQFKPTVMRSIVSLSISGLAGVTLAVLGAGVWALVCQALVHRLTGALALWLAVPLRFRLAFSRRHFRELWRIAVPLLAARCMGWAGGQIPRFVLGFHLGTLDLGLYSLGTRFADILIKLTIEPRNVVARIGFRRFASEPYGLEDGVRSLLMRISAFCFPLCLGGVAIVPTLFHAWLDARWQGGIVSVQLMLLSCIPYVTYFCTTAVLLALNQRAAEATISTLQALTAMVAVLIGARFGLNVASGAISGALFALLPLPLLLLKRRCGLPIRAVLGAQMPALASSILMGTAVWLVGREFEASLSSLMLLPILVVSGAVVYGVSIGVLAPKLIRQQIRGLLTLTSGAAAEMRTNE